jgi:hypothetical protein
MKLGQVFYLSRPDIPKDAQTHGYLWVFLHFAKPNHDLSAYQSVATGVNKLFFDDEMDPVEKEG